MLLETPLTMDEVARGVVTPGGITEQGRKILDAAAAGRRHLIQSFNEFRQGIDMAGKTIGLIRRSL